MAEQVLKKLEDQLNCSICLDTYTDPKQLNCNHVFCQKCLTKLVIRNQQGQLVLTCPNCRQITPVPASGVAGLLQATFQLSHLLELVEEHKKATGNAERLESASTSPYPPGKITTGCPQHGGRDVELYCETCGETICYKCIKKGEKHHSHDYEELDEAFEEYKKEIISSMEPMEKQLVTIERALAQLDACCEEIANQQATMEANIHDTIRRLHQTLDVRKTELIGQLHRLTQAKLKSLAAQRDKIETTQARLSSCLHFMGENLKTDNQGEALMMKTTTVRQVKELTTTLQPDILEPNTKADMTFSALADITAVIQDYGRIHEKGLPDPSKCTATGKGIQVAAVGKKSTALLQTLSFDNQPSKEAVNSITCELVSELTGTRVRSSVEKRGQSQYEISYKPTIKGRHQLHIKVEGQHIMGSPYPVTVKSPVENLSTSIGGVRTPWGVAVNQRGEVVVTEGGRHCVSMFSPSGEKLRSFGRCGSDQGQFDLPCGVAVDGKGCILVTDSNNHRIQKFTVKGKFLTEVGSNGSGPLQFTKPCGIAYNASNDKVYVGDGNCRIQILNSDLNYVGNFGEEGRDQGQFNNPQHLGCDSTGNVYVADRDNQRIQVFTAEGKFLGQLGQCGRGRLEGPTGVAIDSSNRVYISEWVGSRVSVYTSKGEFVTTFGRRGNGPGQFYRPTGLAVDSNGVLYVCDLGNDRVQIF